MGMSPLQHTMLKLPFLLVLLVVGQNHAKLSSIGKQKLMEYRTMLEAAEKEDLGDAADVGNAGIKNAATAAEGKDPPDLDNTAGDSTKVYNTEQKQMAQLIKSIFGQLSSGQPVKMIVDIKNPEVMIGNNEVNGIVEQPELEIKQQEAGVQAGKGPSLGLELGKQVGSMQAPAPATVQAMSSASLKKPNSRSVIYHGQD